MKRVLFARIGWMKFYQGPLQGDEKPIGGGSNNEHDIGGELYNFLNDNGTYFGYFQPHMKKPYNLNLARIEKGYNKDKIEGVLVIWFATDPVNRGQFVVGWYNNATVYKTIQTPREDNLRNDTDYYVSAPCEECCLLPTDKRTFRIGHEINADTKKGNPGIANAFYLLENDGSAKDITQDKHKWIHRVLQDVNSYKGPNIASASDWIQAEVGNIEISTGGQGFKVDPKTKKLIEDYAMKECRSYYTKNGYDVEDHSKTKPYDFKISKNSKTYYVEVKGTTTNGASIIITKNEVELNCGQPDKMILFIVHSIKFDATNENSKPEGGIIKIVKPWNIDRASLIAITYTYQIPPHN